MLEFIVSKGKCKVIQKDGCKVSYKCKWVIKERLKDQVVA